MMQYDPQLVHPMTTWQAAVHILNHGIEARQIEVGGCSSVRQARLSLLYTSLYTVTELDCLFSIPTAYK